MHGTIGLAVDADAGTVDLGQAIDVIEFDAELVGDATAHLLAPAFRADDALAQPDLVADATLGYLLGKTQRVRARRAKHRALEVHHHLELLVGVARAHGNCHGAKQLASRLEADAGRP